MLCNIDYIDYYIPSNTLTIDNLLKQDSALLPENFQNMDEYETFVRDILKLKSIRAEEKLSSFEMIDSLVEKLFSNTDTKNTDIDVIILAQEHGQADSNSINHDLRKKYKMFNALTIDVSGNQCVNIEIALKLSNDILSNNKNINNILIVSSAKLKSPEERIYGAYAVYGDGAGIILLNKKQTGVRFADVTTVNNGLKSSSKLDAGNVVYHNIYLSKCIKTLVERNQINNNNISNIIIHNANPLLAIQCVQSVGIDIRKIFLKNLGNYGHLNQLDYLINLKDIISGNIDKEYILSLGFCESGTYISTLLQRYA